ncbi:MAG: polyphosphate kinase 1 [Armatimonadetes bacterium]|nr:polyphosphate kinase 1 [Armatimonadota bacterium]
MDLKDARLYINREQSWLEFNHRVLEEASDPHNPLLEQLKFLAIVSSNLDEFFMVRVAGVMSQVHAGVTRAKGTDPSPPALLAAIRRRTQRMVREQYQRLREGVLPGLRAEGLRLLALTELTAEQREAADRFFRERAFPVLSPLAIDPAHPVPHLHNMSLNLIVALEGPANGEACGPLAFVEVPAVLPRFVPLPSADGQRDFIALGSLIAAHLGELFLGYGVRSATLFRVTRDADLNIDEDDAEDLLRDIEQALRERDRGRPVRLEIEAGCDTESLAYLQRTLELGDDDTYVIDGPLNLKDFFALAGTPGFDRLRYRSFLPRITLDADGQDDLFAAIRRRPIFMHHPFDSFATVVEFLRQAADDPDVLAIKMTLYRTSGDSPVVQALARAAENGKQVAALVELKARFDEGSNIRWARALEQAGVHVVYGLVGLKTHCKVVSVVRREREGLRFYVHLGTGNYHPQTARLYTDCGLLTCDQAIGEDVSQLFNILTGYSQFPTWRKLAVAPEDLKKRVIELIRAEAELARSGVGGQVIAKCNAIIEPDVIEALYEASMAGVQIDLISRGICGLVPGVKGVSETIRVRSIVGRFLEHSRVFCFGNGGDPKLYMASADWMERNLNRRIETMFPIEDPALRDHIIRDILMVYLADNAKARLLQSDGSWVRPARAVDAPLLNAQEEFLRLSAQSDPSRTVRKFGASSRFLARGAARTPK